MKGFWVGHREFFAKGPHLDRVPIDPGLGWALDLEALQLDRGLTAVLDDDFEASCSIGPIGQLPELEAGAPKRRGQKQPQPFQPLEGKRKEPGRIHPQSLARELTMRTDPRMTHAEAIKRQKQGLVYEIRNGRVVERRVRGGKRHG